MESIDLRGYGRLEINRGKNAARTDRFGFGVLVEEVVRLISSK